ncbi:MAG: peptide chain release factor N(5)-glutamine methyltransferase [Parachlamydiaceae bacterium]|nr:peptide chain release factor N(5)-glutamine methyltransferase [Parachlamydiaceae bacterium]
MRTILEILTLSTDYLTRKGILQPRLQAEELVSQSLGLKRMDLYIQFDRPLVDEELSKCRDWLQRRGQGEPLQYIHGQVDFFDCMIKVTSAVLIPRQETEILVDKISKVLAHETLANKVLWDICCGSGCIGIALKKRFPDLTVCLSDISAEALTVAAENAKSNFVEVELLEGDLLLPFKEKFSDFVVCNPPYISEKEFSALDIEVRAHEPRRALISGESGLEFYKRLANDLPSHLNSGSKVWFEIGANQGQAVQSLFQGAFWKKCCVENDWSGHERFFSLEIE